MEASEALGAKLEFEDISEYVFLHSTSVSDRLLTISCLEQTRS